jgi:hypothetical protein
LFLCLIQTISIVPAACLRCFNREAKIRRQPLNSRPLYGLIMSRLHTPKYPIPVPSHSNSRKKSKRTHRPKLKKREGVGGTGRMCNLESVYHEPCGHWGKNINSAPCIRAEGPGLSQGCWEARLNGVVRVRSGCPACTRRRGPFERLSERTRTSLKRTSSTALTRQ